MRPERETVTSPLSIVTNQVSVFLPFAMSNRMVPLAFPSRGSCPRCARSSKNSAVRSAIYTPPSVVARTGGDSSRALGAPSTKARPKQRPKHRATLDSGTADGRHPEWVIVPLRSIRRSRRGRDERGIVRSPNARRPAAAAEAGVGGSSVSGDEHPLRQLLRSRTNDRESASCRLGLSAGRHDRAYVSTTPAPGTDVRPERKFKFPTAFTVLAGVLLLVWIASFFVPAGAYKSDTGGAPVPGTYHKLPSLLRRRRRRRRR